MPSCGFPVKPERIPLGTRAAPRCEAEESGDAKDPATHAAVRGVEMAMAWEKL